MWRKDTSFKTPIHWFLGLNYQNQKTSKTTRVFQTENTCFCFQPQLANLCATSSRGRPASCHRPLPQQEPLLQQETDSELHFHPRPQDNPLPSSSSVPSTARNTAGEDGSRSSTDSPSVGSTGDMGETGTTLLLHCCNKEKCHSFSIF